MLTVLCQSYMVHGYKALLSRKESDISERFEIQCKVLRELGCGMQLCMQYFTLQVLAIKVTKSLQTTQS